jgi:hypothetical protein
MSRNRSQLAVARVWPRQALSLMDTVEQSFQLTELPCKQFSEFDLPTEIPIHGLRVGVYLWTTILSTSHLQDSLGLPYFAARHQFACAAFPALTRCSINQ